MLVRAARDGSAGPCGGTSGAEGLERQRLAAVRDSTECYAILLRTCNPSKRHREGHAGSECRVLSPDEASEGGQQGGNGLRNGEIDPARHSGRALGFRNP